MASVMYMYVPFNMCFFVQSDRDNVHGQQPSKQLTSSMPQNIADQSNSQMELAGHSNVRISL